MACNFIVPTSFWFMLILIILGGSICTIKKNTEALVVASKQMELEVNVDKTKYMVTSQDQNAGRRHNIKIDGVPLTGWKSSTNQNYIQEEIKSRLKSGNACYHSVQNLLSSNLLSKTIKMKTYRTIILPVVLYGCETWSLILREKHRLRVFDNWVLRRIFGPKRDRKTWKWRKLHNEELNDL